MATDRTRQTNWASSWRPSVHEQRESPVRRSLVSRHPAVVAFGEGFVGGMTGGASYRLCAAYFQAGWIFSWLDVLALALILGSFEAWRVARGRSFQSVQRQLVGILLATSLLWWSLAR